MSQMIPCLDRQTVLREIAHFAMLVQRLEAPGGVLRDLPLAKRDALESARKRLADERAALVILDGIEGHPATHCDGCDEKQRGVQPFRIKVRGGSWEMANYCPECADMAGIDFSGTIEQIETDDAVRSTRLARAFVSIIRRDLTAAELTEAVRRNRTEKYVGACATHDFIDANEAMLEAFMAVEGRACEVNSDADALLWTAAWDKARAASFVAEDVR